MQYGLRTRLGHPRGPYRRRGDGSNSLHGRLHVAQPDEDEPVRDVGIDGTLHRALGPKPNSAYVLGKDGTILFRAHWANDGNALAGALDAVAAGASPSSSQSGGIIPATVRFLGNVAPVLDRAGAGAWGDMWRAAPPMTAMAFALKILRVRPPNPGAQQA